MTREHVAFARRARTPGAGRHVFRAECEACGYEGQWHDTEYPTSRERALHERHPFVRISFVRHDGPGNGFLHATTEEHKL